MKRTQCYIIIVFLSFIFFVYIIDNIKSDRGRGGGGGGNGDKDGEEYSLPFNFPHPMETMDEKLPYHYFEGLQIYGGNRGEEIERPISLHENLILAQVKNVATQTLQRNTDLISGRYRWLPDGLEHDLLYKDSGSHQTHRVILFQKLTNVQVVRSIQVNHTKAVHIIITLKGRLDKYQTFLDHLTTNIIPNDINLSLTIAYFNDKNTQKARNITAAKLANFPGFRWTFLPLGGATGEEVFSRGKGLHLGALQATQDPSDLIFFCDVDVLMKVDFFTRCRANTLLGRQVYYPMVFSLYNPKLVYPLQDQAIPPIPEQLTVGQDSGFWREFGYGMSCVSRGDYEKAGGFLDIKVWGGEDEALYQQFLNQQHIKVIRAPDPSLFHLHHVKECEATGDAAYVSCLKSRAKTEGSKMQLGLALLKMQHGTDIEGVLSKRFYYFWLVPYLGSLLALSLLTNLLLALLMVTYAKKSATSKVL